MWQLFATESITARASDVVGRDRAVSLYDGLFGPSTLEQRSPTMIEQADLQGVAY